MENTVFEISGKEFDVVKRGLPQAQQVAGMGRWLAQYGSAAFRTISGDAANMGAVELIGSFLGGLSGEALVDLFAIVFGCDIAFSEENFDIAVMIEGMVALYDNSPSIKRLMNRFFSVTRSSATEESTSTQSE